MIRRPVGVGPNPISSVAHTRTSRRRTSKAVLKPKVVAAPPPPDRMSAAAGAEVEDRLEAIFKSFDQSERRD